DQAVDTLFKYGIDRNYIETRRLFQQGLEQLNPQADEALHRGWGRLLARSFSALATGRSSLWDILALTYDSPLEQALQIARQHSDMAEIGFCLWGKGTREYALGHPVFAAAEISRALTLFEQSLSYYDKVDDELYRAFYTAEACFWIALSY